MLMILTVSGAPQRSQRVLVKNESRIFPFLSLVCRSPANRAPIGFQYLRVRLSPREWIAAMHQSQRWPRSVSSRRSLSGKRPSHQVQRCQASPLSSVISISRSSAFAWVAIFVAQSMQMFSCPSTVRRMSSVGLPQIAQIVFSIFASVVRRFFRVPGGLGPPPFTVT